MGDDCSQCCKHCAINNPCVIEEGADNFLDNVFVIFVLKGWWSLLLRRIAPLIHSEALHVGMVGFRSPQLRLMEKFDEVGHVVEHGKVDF